MYAYFCNLALGGIAHLRMNYFTLVNTADGLLASVNSHVVLAVFWAINSLMFLLAIVLCFYAHDSDHAFEKTFLKYSQLQQELTMLRGRINELAAQRFKNFDVTKRRLQAYEDTFRSLVARYRRANLRARKQDDREVTLFEKEPSLECSIAMRNPFPKEEPI